MTDTWKRDSSGYVAPTNIQKSQRSTQVCLSSRPRPSPPTMSRLPRRPSRTNARRVASSVSLLCLALIALICLCPLSVKADDEKEYGTVIGIGTWPSHSSFSHYTNDHVRSWNDVSKAAHTSLYSNLTALIVCAGSQLLVCWVSRLLAHFSLPF